MLIKTAATTAKTHQSDLRSVGKWTATPPPQKRPIHWLQIISNPYWAFKPNKRWGNYAAAPKFLDRFFPTSEFFGKSTWNPKIHDFQIWTAKTRACVLMTFQKFKTTRFQRGGCVQKTGQFFLRFQVESGLKRKSARWETKTSACDSLTFQKCRDIRI